MEEAQGGDSGFQLGAVWPAAEAGVTGGQSHPEDDAARFDDRGKDIRGLARAAGEVLVITRVERPLAAGDRQSRRLRAMPIEQLVAEFFVPVELAGFRSSRSRAGGPRCRTRVRAWSREGLAFEQRAKGGGERQRIDDARFVHRPPKSARNPGCA